MDYTVKIGGEAGQGIQTVGETLSRVFARSGYHVFSHQDYESRIRGGHNFYQIRVADSPVTASVDRVDILAGFDRASIDLHAAELSPKGRVLYDSATLKRKEEGDQFFDVPFEALAVTHGGSRIMANTVAVGAILGILGMELDILSAIISDTFRKKGDAVIRENLSAARAGFEYAIAQCRDCALSAAGRGEPKMLITGIDAIGFGAVSAGCRFISAYPMTPSTGVMNYLAGKEKEFGILVEQAEDEISAINMALGASFAGVRAMTATSGGGFALMVEGLSLAAMTETPVVIALGQRPGPATGLPTRTEQGELQFALYTAHGEFPRVIFAPGSPEQACYLTNKAFDLAEKYQVPAIIIFDQYLADTEWTYSGLDLKKLVFSDYRLRAERLENLVDYRRYAFTDTGVSPLAVPGDSRHVVVADSDEHNEEGHIVEDVETRERMVDKRLLKKVPLILREMSPPILYGDERPEIVLVGWGSTYGVIKEAVDELAGSRKIAMLHFCEIFPFPASEAFDYLSLLKNAGKTLCIENNATGQFARLMRAETGYEMHAQIHRYDGRPFTRDGLLKEIYAHLG